MATWPTSLPQYGLLEPTSEAVPAPSLIISEMDVGPPKRRQRYTKEVHRFSMTMYLTATQVGTLETFYITTLGHGVDSFDWVNPRTKAAATVWLASRPRYVAVTGTYWQVDFEIELLV